MIHNPILKGFNPDPSIVRVDDDYYIATSTFEWYPGVQIHHSRDLVHWRLITRPLRRASQLNMLGDPDSCGIWAPCLTHADGLFHLIYTDVKRYGRMGEAERADNHQQGGSALAPWPSGEGSYPIGGTDRKMLVTTGKLGIIEPKLAGHKDNFNVWVLVSEVNRESVAGETGEANVEQSDVDPVPGVYDDVRLLNGGPELIGQRPRPLRDVGVRDDQEPLGGHAAEPNQPRCHGPSTSAGRVRGTPTAPATATTGPGDSSLRIPAPKRVTTGPGDRFL